MNQSNAEKQYDELAEDEIDLRQLLTAVFKYKVKIVFFSLVAMLIAVIYLLRLPNTYDSKTILAPQEKTQSLGGGLGALAGMAGISLGGGQMDAFSSLQTIMQDYDFNRHLIAKYDLINKLLNEELTKEYVFALGFDGVYRLFHSEKTIKQDESTLYQVFRMLQKFVSITSDSKSGAIIIRAEHPNRFFAKELATIFLNEAVARLRSNEMQDIDKQISYYENEIAKTSQIQLREQLSTMVATLIQKKVMAQGNAYYIVQPVTMPYVANIKDRSGPNRGTTVIIVLMASLMLGVFAAVAYEFAKTKTDQMAY